MKSRFLIVLLLLFLSAVTTHTTLWAQEGGSESDIVEALLIQLRAAYAHTAEQSSYQVTVEETTTQFTSIRRFHSTSYLTDVTLYESYVNTQTLETSVEGVVVEDDLSATFDMNISQVQGLGFEYVRNDTVLATPEDTEDELELTLQLVKTDDGIYINTDETDPEYREGVPVGWRLLTSDGTPILSNASITDVQVAEVVDGLYFSATSVQMQALLQHHNIHSIDILGLDEIDGQLVRRYQITFDGTAALESLGLDYDQILEELSAAAQIALPDATPELRINYTLEVAIGIETNLVYDQILTLSIEGVFSSGADSAAYQLEQVNARTYRGFGESYAIPSSAELLE